MADSKLKNTALVEKKRILTESLRQDYQTRIRRFLMMLIQPFCCKLEENAPYINSRYWARCLHTNANPQREIENREMLIYARNFLKYMDAKFNYFAEENINLKSDNQRNLYTCVFKVGENSETITLYHSINSDTKGKNGQLKSITSNKEFPKKESSSSEVKNTEIEMIASTSNVGSIVEDVGYGRNKKRNTMVKNTEIEMIASTSNVGSIVEDVGYGRNKKRNTMIKE